LLKRSIAPLKVCDRKGETRQWQRFSITLMLHWMTRRNWGHGDTGKLLCPASALNSGIMERTPENTTSGQTDSDVLQAFSDLNLIIDEKGIILDQKPGSLLPPPFPGTVLGAKIQDLLISASVDTFREMLQTVQQTGTIKGFECKFPIADHEHWFDARLIPISASQFLFVARDVTKCRETEYRMTQQMQQLSMLRSIDLAIASGLDLNLLLAMLVDQLVELMHIDAVAILLQNSKSNLLEFTAGKGFRSTSLQYTHLRLGEGCAGRVAMERKMLNVPNLKENQMEFGRSPLFQVEDFTAYFGVPLIAKGRVLGVLEIFHRSTLQPNADWLIFLNAIAGQAAIAIDNAVLFRELQKSNAELSLAYDATIEGLSQALDLRDKETEEHTRRVSEITVNLAVRLGIEDSDLVHVRRGAILHDIGKVAIPDRILFKPGPLTEEEWKIMRQHPGIAVNLLSSVSYLAPALTIPHWHHEKWDGSGYPDRLRGTEIPFSARLFALVDVYDALTSNRSYRGAWSQKETLQYIEGQSGRHFDPALVPEFIRYVSKHLV
jgi:putative nucleotidyltransferase with HDIG domain